MSPTASAANSPEGDARQRRVFAALRVPAPVASALGARAREALAGSAAPHWTDPANYHLTLVFLGDLSADALAALVAALGASPRRDAVWVTPTAIARFPSPSGPIVAALVAQTPALLALRHDLVAAAGQGGIATETRPYRPHITLGRVGRGMGMDAGAVSLAGLGFRAGCFGLYRGERTGGAAGEHYRYRALATFPLD
ncbi:MAG: RNA 2',3'-cyclic phosphodiesterase [Porticoccaceae bacterium]|nr:RNA 2',3'-cyclic phosphodiesterase [Porticoccaceae bacterium]